MPSAMRLRFCHEGVMQRHEQRKARLEPQAGIIIFALKPINDV